MPSTTISGVTYTSYEHFDGRPVRASMRSAQTATRRFEVVTSEIVSGVLVLSAMPTLESTWLGNSHPNYANMYVVDGQADPDDEDPFTWMVTIQYEEPGALPGTVPGMPNGGTVGGRPGAGGSGTPHQPPRPQDRPTFFSIDYRKEPRYFRTDVFGKNLVNSADDPLEDVPPEYLPIGVLKATRFYESWSFGLGMAVIARTNQDTWRGYPPDRWLIEACPAAPKTQNGWSFWEVTYTLAYNPDGWNPARIIDAGRTYYEGGRIIGDLGDGPQVVSPKLLFRDDQGIGIGERRLLDGNGAPLRKGDPPVSLLFNFYRRVNFNGLIDP